MRKWLIRGLLTIGVLLLLACIGGYALIQSKAPDYEEVLDLPGISAEVNVYYDQYAIPHIYATNIVDAYKAMGYVHAKDRLWQMDLLRRIAPGRLSELFGPATLETDRFFRTVGLAHQSKKEAIAFAQRADGPLRDMVMGYIDGVNQYIDKGEITVEHQLLGLEMTPYTLEDVYNVIGYMAFSFSIAHRTEPIMDFVSRSLGPGYLDALDVHVAPGTSVLQSNDTMDYSLLSMHFHQMMEGLPAPELIGSNSWVISAEKSASGGVLFANDPHIGFSQPAVWYEAHINAPGFELYGYHIAGFPIAQIGHNRHHAIGLTMFENDDIDYYREIINPDNGQQYRAVDQWQTFQERQETIKVKGGMTDTISIRESRHGPIISDVVEHISSDDAISMWWTYQKLPLELLEASYKIITSESMEEAREGASMIHAPGLNVMYGDVDGNIAWWAAAKLPKRPPHVNSKLILNGASGADDIVEYYDFAENPQAVNPPWGYVHSANNQAVTPGSLRPEGYYLPEDRSRRISHLLDDKDQWTLGDVKDMLNDVTSDNTPEIAQTIVDAISIQGLSEDEGAALDILADWRGTYHLEDVAPTIYVKLVYHILYGMMGDELGDRWETFNGTHVYKRSIQPLIANATTKWWDNTNTTKKEAREDIIAMALSQTVSELQTQLGPDMKQWQWQKVHTLEHPHSFDANPSLRTYFNVGPFEVPGATEVINNLQFITSADGTYEVKAGPSTRRAIDLSKLGTDSWSILPTGQSGNVMSPHYSDQAEMYVEGAFRRQLMDKEEIMAEMRYHTVIR